MSQRNRVYVVEAYPLEHTEGEGPEVVVEMPVGAQLLSVGLNADGVPEVHALVCTAASGVQQTFYVVHVNEPLPPIGYCDYYTFYRHVGSTGLPTGRHVHVFLKDYDFSERS